MMIVVGVGVGVRVGNRLVVLVGTSKLSNVFVATVKAAAELVDVAEAGAVVASTGLVLMAGAIDVTAVDGAAAALLAPWVKEVAMVLAAAATPTSEL